MSITYVQFGTQNSEGQTMPAISTREGLRRETIQITVKSTHSITRYSDGTSSMNNSFSNTKWFVVDAERSNRYCTRSEVNKSPMQNCQRTLTKSLPRTTESGYVVDGWEFITHTTLLPPSLSVVFISRCKQARDESLADRHGRVSAAQEEADSRFHASPS